MKGTCEDDGAHEAYYEGEDSEERTSNAEALTKSPH